MELRVHEAILSTGDPSAPGGQLLVHNAVVVKAPEPQPQRELRVHSASLHVTKTPVPKQLLVHRAVFVVGAAASPRGGWFVRRNGAWVPHRPVVKVGAKWL